MAKLHIAEFGAVIDGAAAAPPLAEQVIDISGKSIQSQPFHQHTNAIRVLAMDACCVAFGMDPTATSLSMPFSAKQLEYFRVSPLLRLAVISQ